MYRHEVINNLQLDHALVILVADNLTAYVDQVRHNPPKVSFSWSLLSTFLIFDCKLKTPNCWQH